MSDRNSQAFLYMAKVEAVEGTDAVPVIGSDAIQLVQPFDPDYDHAFKIPRPTLVKGADFRASPPLPPKGKIFAWTKSAWYRGLTAAITAGNKIEIDAWLQAMGFSVTYSGVAGAEQAAYVFANTGLKTMTEYAHEDGLLYKGIGARAEGTFSFDVGGPLVVECASQGRFSAVSEVATPATATVTFKSSVPPVATDMTAFSIDGFAAGIIRRFRCSTGNGIQRRDGVKATGGVAGHRIMTGAPTWECVLEEPLLSEKDFRALVDSQADVVLSWLLGSVLYNKLQFDAAQARIERVQPSTDNGMPVITISGGLYGGTPVQLTAK